MHTGREKIVEVGFSDHHSRWNYFHKMRGRGKKPPAVKLKDIGWSWFGVLIGIGIVAWMNQFALEGTGLLMMVGSFGASAALVYSSVDSPFAQPRNLLGGHVLSALIGVTVHRYLPVDPWLVAAIAVAMATAAMHVTRTFHPPGGGTALIAVIGGAKIKSLGYLYALFPVAAGAVTLLIVAVFVNNIPAHRRYPVYWW